MSDCYLSYDIAFRFAVVYFVKLIFSIKICLNSDNNSYNFYFVVY